MGEKKSKWLEHLKAAESSGLKLSAYAATHQIDVRRLYEAKRKRAQQAASNWAVVRLKPGPPAQVTPKAREWVAPATVGMQARLGNGIVSMSRSDSRQVSCASAITRNISE